MDIAKTDLEKIKENKIKDDLHIHTLLKETLNVLIELK